MEIEDDYVSVVAAAECSPTGPSGSHVPDDDIQTKSTQATMNCKACKSHAKKLKMLKRKNRTLLTRIKKLSQKVLQLRKVKVAFNSLICRMMQDAHWSQCFD